MILQVSYLTTVWPNWSRGCRLGVQKKKQKNRILTVMRLATTRLQANKVLIDKRKHQFSLTTVVSRVTRNRQIFAAVGDYLVEKIYSLRLVIATCRCVKIPKTRKQLIAAANSPLLVNISDDANRRFLNSQLFFCWLIKNNSRLHNKRNISLTKFCPGH